MNYNGLEWADLIQMTIINYYCGQESLRRNEVAFTVNKRVWNAVIGGNLKKKKKKNQQNNLCLFQRQTISITVIQVYVPTINAKVAEV